MKLIKYLFIGSMFLFCRIESVYAQNFKGEQRTLQASINSAYKSKKLTAKEYAKLLDEQEIIKTTILKAQADGVMTPPEKNRIHSKLLRARKRPCQIQNEQGDLLI